MERIWNFLKEEDGLELSEYAVMGGIIIVALAATIGLLGDTIDGALNGIVTAITGVGAG